MNRYIWLGAIACATVIVVGQPAAAITIETVPVGDPGNPAGDRGNGAVYSVYHIGKYEVTVGQYATFLNAVAATDRYELYNPSMATDERIAGIARSGSPGRYTYDVIGSPNKPVTYVNWADGQRFCNWLHNGQPVGLQDDATTEDGAYALHGAHPAVAPSISRKPDAQWVLPSVDQWYKAGHYQPAEQGGDVDGYWRYPTRSNDEPYSAEPPGNDAPDPTRTANVRGLYGDYAVPGVNRLTDVGAYEFSAGPYGTFDQAGNVLELANVGPYLYLVGGDWHNGAGITASIEVADSITEDATRGFRIASGAIPEPDSAIVALVACGAACSARFHPFRKRR